MKKTMLIEAIEGSSGAGTSQTSFLLKIKLSDTGIARLEYTDVGNNAEYESSLVRQYDRVIDHFTEADTEMVHMALDEYPCLIDSGNMFMLDYETETITPIIFLSNLFREG